MLIASAPVAPLGWLVFVETPVQEAYAPLYASLQRQDNVTEVEDGDRLPLDQLVETLAAQAKALGLHIDLSYKFHDPGRFGGVNEPKLIEGVVKRSEEKKR